jgi:hypothetical protein
MIATLLMRILIHFSFDLYFLILIYIFMFSLMYINVEVVKFLLTC